jgi:CheY-like chemotaxis protein
MSRRSAGTAAECLEKLDQETFDCMVLDLTLPDRSGMELLETLSRNEEKSFPPVIVYTGHDLSVDEEQRLRRLSSSIIIKGAKSPERLLDEVTSSCTRWFPNCRRNSNACCRRPASVTRCWKAGAY